MNGPLLADWTPAEFQALEEGVIVARHRLLESGLFTDENLARLIDTHPAECLHVNTMGTDENEFEWREGDRNGVPGDVLLETLRTGRLWMNLRNVLDHHDDFARLVHGVYDELEANCSHFKATDRSANLLLSSPNAIVHYHVDIPVNMLWHLRGEKRVWVYPHFDDRFCSREVMEKVFVGELSEDVPYDTDFDRYALTFDVQPGELITWPQNTPHRVTNLDSMNVSLSTEHKNPRARRRVNVIQANHWLRRQLRWACRSVDVDGPVAHLKQALMRGVRLARKLRKHEAPHYTYPKTFKVDPTAPLGYVDISRDAAEAAIEEAREMLAV